MKARVENVGDIVFPFLIGRLRRTDGNIRLMAAGRFPFLIGRLRRGAYSEYKRWKELFPFLIGRLRI